jgi:hypothetical protein
VRRQGVVRPRIERRFEARVEARAAVVIVAAGDTRGVGEEEVGIEVLRLEGDHHRARLDELEPPGVVEPAAG